MELFFDTETSGFISKKIPQDSWGNAWVVQLAAILSTKERVYQEFNIMIAGVEREMGKYAQEVHGISLEDSNTGGLLEVEALTMFSSLLSFNPTKVCHNIAFDFGHIDAMLARNQEDLNDLTRSRYYLDLPECCTMRESTAFCKLPKTRGSGYKWPKLEELYRILFGEDFEGAHDALADVRATRRCYYELVEKGVIS